jgi:hypothetical protein
MLNFMKIRLVGAELFIGTNVYDETNSLFSQYCERA